MRRQFSIWPQTRHVGTMMSLRRCSTFGGGEGTNVHMIRVEAHCTNLHTPHDLWLQRCRLWLLKCERMEIMSVCYTIMITIIMYI